MESQESKVFHLLTRLKKRDEIKLKSAKVIGVLGRAKMSKGKEKSVQKTILLQQLLDHIEELNQLKR